MNAKLPIIISLAILLGLGGAYGYYRIQRHNANMQHAAMMTTPTAMPTVVMSPAPTIVPTSAKESNTQLQSDLNTDVSALNADATVGNTDSVNDSDFQGL